MTNQNSTNSERVANETNSRLTNTTYNPRSYLCPESPSHRATSSQYDSEIDIKKASAWVKLKTFFRAVNQINPHDDSVASNVLHCPDRPNSFLEKFTKPTNTKPDQACLDKQNTFAFSNGIPIYQSEKSGFRENVFTKYSVVNPEGNPFFIWLGVVVVAWLYSIWTLIARQAFLELQQDWKKLWYTMDYTCDIIYLFDILVQFRTGFLKHGLLVFNTRKMAVHYGLSWKCAADVLSLLPLDLIYIGADHVEPLIRFPRFFKVYRARFFVRHAESRTTYPNLLRGLFLIHILMLLMHWFACFYFMISELEGFVHTGPDRGWAYPFPSNRSSISEFNTLHRKYLHSLYWSCLTLTTIGEKHSPETNLQYVCTLTAYFLGIFLFATVVGQVGNVISAKNADRLEFERLTDNAKHFMKSKNIPSDMQRRVMRWYAYSWSRGLMRGTTDVNSLGMMPDMLKVELAILVNMNTLRKVSIFKLVQPEFLYDLVLKMKSYIFTPGDLICRKGEIAKEMYIISHGVLEVVGDNGEVLALLRAGDFFGEIGVLNITGGVNKRVANVRSVGYSEVFALSATDVTQAMEHYPDAKNLLMIYGKQRLQTNQEKKDTSQHDDSCSSSEEEDELTEDIEVAEETRRNSRMNPELLINLSSNLPHTLTPHKKVTRKSSESEGICQNCNKEYVDNMVAIVLRCVDGIKLREHATSTHLTLSDAESRSVTPSKFALKRFKEKKNNLKQQLKEKNKEIKDLQEDVRLLMQKVTEVMDYREHRKMSVKTLSSIGSTTGKKRRFKTIVKSITGLKALDMKKRKGSFKDKDKNNDMDQSTHSLHDIESISSMVVPNPTTSSSSPEIRVANDTKNNVNQTTSTIIDMEEVEDTHDHETKTSNV